MNAFPVIIFPNRDPLLSPSPHWSYNGCWSWRWNCPDLVSVPGSTQHSHRSIQPTFLGKAQAPLHMLILRIWNLRKPLCVQKVLLWWSKENWQVPPHHFWISCFMQISCVVGRRGRGLVVRPTCHVQGLVSIYPEAHAQDSWIANT